MAFHPYPQVIAAVFNRRAFGPPRGLTPASACPRIAHPASRPRRGTQVALLRLAFATAPSRLTSPRASDSLAHSTKGTPSHPQRVLRLLVGARFQVLFHSPPGVLFTFPSRYSCAIGHWRVFRLGGWSPLLPTGFHVSGGTQATAVGPRGFAYGALTLYRGPSQALPLPRGFVTEQWPCLQPRRGLSSRRFGLIPVRSPLLGESRLISLPPGT